MMLNKILMVDPPSGWKYGYPRRRDISISYEDQLRNSGYPEKDIDMAVKHSRWWEIFE